MSLRCLLGLLLLICSGGANADQDQTHPLIADGVRLHDAGDYAGAIEQYQAAIDDGADTVLARYEMALSYLALDDKTAALAIAEQAAEEDHPLRPKLYMIIGSILDQTGDSDAAINTFEKAIALEPDSFLLHFNLGVTLLGREEWEPARPHFERALVLNPDHPSSHLYLGLALSNLDQRMPAIAAYTRFLMLEPTSARAAYATEAIEQLFLTGYGKDSENGATTITIGDSGDVEKNAADLALLIVQAAADQKEGDGSADLVSRLRSALAIFAELSKPESPGFAADYYAPYFQALLSAELLETACNFALQDSDHAAVDWLGEHADQVEALRTLTAEHVWTGRSESGNPD